MRERCPRINHRREQCRARYSGELLQQPVYLPIYTRNTHAVYTYNIIIYCVRGHFSHIYLTRVPPPP